METNEPSRRRAARPKNGFKLVAIDLDGTLLDARGEPHAADVRALIAARERGVIVSIATGRLYSGSRASIAAVGIAGPVACADGSHVVHAPEGRTIEHHGVTGDHAIALKNSVKKHALSPFLFAEDAIVYDDSGDELIGYVRYWSNDVRRAERVTDHPFWESEGGVTAVVAIGPEANVLRCVGEIEHELHEVTQVASFPLRRLGGAKWGMIVRAKHPTKGTALAWLAAHHGISLDECVAIGDWMNDVPMLAVAGRSFAMGQAPDPVKRAATDVLEETSEHGGGIARAIREAFGIVV